ncbi:Cyclin-T1 [Arthrobotrys entomopaga]|nr:Cyclin-T1 [Arthrobotrys entomopaga]
MATTTHRDDQHDTPRANRRPHPRPNPHPHLVTKDAVSFMAILADILRLQEESLSTAYIYMHKYRKFIRDFKSTPDFLDPHTLALTSLSLSTKATESPRRLRALLTPAYTLLHPSRPPISVPSHHYDTLRSTLVTAELHLLRILKFELRVPLPHNHIPKILDLSLSSIPGEDYYDISPEKAEEDKIVRVKETYLGRQCGGLATRCLGEYSIANFYDARTLACGVVRVVLEENGVLIATTATNYSNSKHHNSSSNSNNNNNNNGDEDVDDDYDDDEGEGEARWVEMVSGGNVDLEDYRDVVREVREVYGGGSGGIQVSEIITTRTTTTTTTTAVPAAVEGEE